MAHEPFRVEIAGQSLTLLPERALHWDAARTLLLADPHFGKAWTFRSAGIPVPAGGTASSVSRLSQLVEQTAAERLVVLGDFFHAQPGRALPMMVMLGAWRQRHRGLEVILVRGNHDVSAGAPPVEWGFEVVPEWRAGPFLCRHEPRVDEDGAGYVLAGHTHPVVRLIDAAGTVLRAPCFHFAARVGVLPAFGPFTGGHAVRPVPGDRLIAVGPGELAEVELRPRAPRRRG